MSTSDKAVLTAPITSADRRECPSAWVLHRVGDRWSMVVLSLLAGDGAMGFNALDRAVEDLDRRVLTRTLRALERDGLISRTVHDTRPPTVEYALTELGRELQGHAVTLALWAVDRNADVEAARDRFDERN